MTYLVNAVVLVCFYLFMRCSYLMMRRTYAVPSHVVKGGELVTVNILDCEGGKKLLPHTSRRKSRHFGYV